MFVIWLQVYNSNHFKTISFFSCPTSTSRGVAQPHSPRQTKVPFSSNFPHFLNFSSIMSSFWPSALGRWVTHLALEGPNCQKFSFWIYYCIKNPSWNWNKLGLLTNLGLNPISLFAPPPPPFPPSSNEFWHFQFVTEITWLLVSNSTEIKMKLS